MGIVYSPEDRRFLLTTRNTAYQMQLGPLGHLLHLYYGPRCEESFDYLYLPRDRGFSPNPWELREGRGWSLDTVPQEYSGSNAGDFRLPSLEVRTARGVRGADLRYESHEIRPGKYEIPGLPASYAREGEAQTLSITLTDAATGLRAELLYGVFEDSDMIARAARITNGGTETLWLEKAASACLELPFGTWERIHFHGCHTMERQPERAPLLHGIQTAGSRRGASGHQNDPFVILCEPAATEDVGECYGAMLVYSGNHRTEAELSQTGSVRLVTGIGEALFSWHLTPGESFDTPEALLCFTPRGLGELSRLYHRFLRRHLCRGVWAERTRPVLLNSWEALYMDVNEDKLLSLARGAKELGAELLVLDDGWFSGRRDDRRALGDWTPDREKFPDGLERVIAGVRALGLRFGLWVEPEMVSEDSELYRAHPDWALAVPGRKPSVGRDQLVLDLSRKDVADWVYDTMAGLLRRYEIDYIKWDMNRSLTDVYSAALPPERQGEVSHRYMLGLYGVLERLTAEFPAVLFEGCAGGGGRFDAGMLAYCPQIWGSDNTDPVARLAIQRGASFGYPPSVCGAHISASPNHQTGRSTPLGARAVAAMAGSFGLELDPGRLTAEEAGEIRGHVARFRAWSGLLRTGDYYRLTGAEEGPFAAWEVAAADGSEALLSLVVTRPEANGAPLRLRWKGLRPEARYALTGRYYDCRDPFPDLVRREFSGAALLWGGIVLPPLLGNYPSAQLYLRRIDTEEGTEHEAVL